MTKDSPPFDDVEILLRRFLTLGREYGYATYLSAIVSAVTNLLLRESPEVRWSIVDHFAELSKKMGIVDLSQASEEACDKWLGENKGDISIAPAGGECTIRERESG